MRRRGGPRGTPPLRPDRRLSARDREANTGTRPEPGSRNCARQKRTRATLPHSDDLAFDNDSERELPLVVDPGNGSTLRAKFRIVFDEDDDNGIYELSVDVSQEPPPQKRLGRVRVRVLCHLRIRDVPDPSADRPSDVAGEGTRFAAERALDAIGHPGVASVEHRAEQVVEERCDVAGNADLQ